MRRRGRVMRNRSEERNLEEKDRGRVKRKRTRL